MHKAIQRPSFQSQRFVSFRGSRHSPALSPRGPPPQAQEEPRPLRGHHLRRKHNVAPYFCVQKDFAPSSSNCRRCRLLTCKKVGNAPYSSVPQSTWVTSPRHPGWREASDAQRASFLSRRRQQLPRPGPARRAARGPDPGRAEGASGEPWLQSRAARPPPAPGPGALSRASRSRAAGKPGPGPGFHVGEEAAAPRASGGKGGRNPGALGRAALPSRARQDAWGLVRPAHPRGGGLTGPGRAPRPRRAESGRGPGPEPGAAGCRLRGGPAGRRAGAVLRLRRG